jgi:hypothetical protein
MSVDIHRLAGPKPEASANVDQFEHLLELPSDVDRDCIWEPTTDTERQILPDESVPRVNVTPTTSK